MAGYEGKNPRVVGYETTAILSTAVRPVATTWSHCRQSVHGIPPAIPWGMLSAHQLNAISEAIIGAAIEVHKSQGPGLLESVYQECLAYELMLRDVQFESQKPLPIEYKGVRLDCGYRLDFFVEDAVVVEVKSIERIDRIHLAQMLTYLRLAKRHLGLIMNFNSVVLPAGIKRVVQDFPAE